MYKVIGIDLGTTNSCVAVVEGDQTVVLPNTEGSRTTPSVVAQSESGEWLVGQVAKRQAVTNPLNTIYAVKRLMGRRFDSEEVGAAQTALPYTVVPSENGDAWVEIRGRAVSPPEVSAHILRNMKESAEDYLGHSVTDAVVTVPAYFNDSQRQATRDAGRIAGLNVLRIVNEPTSAALAYGLLEQDGKRVAVYDLGGGTFDISILSVHEGVVDVLSTSGNTFLGGEDFDLRVITYLHDKFLGDTGIDLMSDLMALQRLKEAAEKAKCDLSSIEETMIDLPFIANDETGPKHLSESLTRAQLEEMTEDLVRQTIDTCQMAVSDAGLRPGDIDEVLLVGGQTRMPLVRYMVTDFFGVEPSDILDPDEVVAAGAAIQGAVLHGEVADVLLLDVTPLSLGVETQGGVFTRIIDRNSKVPVTASQIFSTTVDNQSLVSVHVLQGERPLAKDNHSLARFDLVGIPPAPRGVPQVQVDFNIDHNGQVSVTATELGTGKQQHVLITANGGLTEHQIEDMIVEASSRAEEDVAQKAVVDLRNRARGLIYTSERSLTEYAEYVGPDALVQLQADLDACRRVVESPQASAQDLDEAILRLEDSAHQLADVLYSNLGYEGEEGEYAEGEYAEGEYAQGEYAQGEYGDYEEPDEPGGYA
jgi:molecular chaperone DnaK